jgi:hypothetical protein
MTRLSPYCQNVVSLTPRFMREHSPGIHVRHRSGADNCRNDFGTGEESKGKRVERPQLAEGSGDIANGLSRSAPARHTTPFSAEVCAPL